uniref:Tumor necrosis factor receptor superfamily member 25 n=1 Tax=Lygus hesperus TaxID=30085 RepID=A0A0A9YCI3_LYGHE
MILYSFLNPVYLATFKMAPSLRCLLLISFISVATTSGAPHHSSEDYEENECDGDHKCGPGFFCYTDTNKCAPCISCASRFRLNSTWQCHQKASDCGDCLPGYQERSLERNIEKESCMPVPEGVITTSKNSAPLPGTTEEMLNLLWFFGGLGGLSLFVIASFLLTQWHKGRSREEPQQEAPQELQELVSRSNQPPPPYSPFGEKHPTSVVNAAPTAPSMDSTLQVDSPRDCDARIYVETQARHIPPPPVIDHANLVQTVPCNLPDWVNGTYCTGLRQSTPPSTGDNSTFSEPDLEDDNTQPSDWTPNTSQENVEEAGNHLMSFNTVPPPIGSTAVGTVDPPIHHGTNINQEVTRVRRRESEDDNQGLASSQESCEDNAPCEKRRRSESPPPQQTRNFHPNVFLNQSNENNNNITQQHYQAIQINVNLNRTDSEPIHNALLDSEDFLA